jgi:hypothetical protein
MAAIAHCEPPNLKAYATILKQTLPLRTRIFSLHVLHFATARSEISVLQHIIKNPTTRLEAVGKTALDHTLLHISTLPLTDVHINLFSSKIFHSVHDVRTLDTKHWVPIYLYRRNPDYRSIFSSVVPRRPLPFARTPEDEDDSRRQAETVLLLLESGTQDLAAQDVYGNTPLHYLASAMWVDEELVRRVRAWEGGRRYGGEEK